MQAKQGSLPSVAVELWCFNLDQAGLPLDRFHHSLAPSEQLRASRFVFPRERARFIVGRYVMRSILSRKLNISPDQVALMLAGNDKPALCAEASLRFNLSHTGPLAMLAVLDLSQAMHAELPAELEIGVDIELRKDERIQDGENAQALFAHCLSKREHQALLALTEEEQRSVFLEIWVRKEASLKALGVGLEVEPHSFDSGWGFGDDLTRPHTRAERYDEIRIPGRCSTGVTQLQDLDLHLKTLSGASMCMSAAQVESGSQLWGRCHGAVSLVNAMPRPSLRTFEFEAP